MKDKIIFLDFDGVIRCYCPYSLDVGGCSFIPEKIELIFQLAKNVGAKVVVTSDWRNLDNRKSIEKNLGVISTVLHCDWATPIIGHRHDEVAKWLEAHDVDDYVIFEDFEMHFNGAPQEMLDRIVWCDTRTGVTEKKIIESYKNFKKQ